MHLVAASDLMGQMPNCMMIIIQRLREGGYNQALIAECLWRDPGTISREIRCKSSHSGFRHKKVQRIAEGIRFFTIRRRLCIFARNATSLD